MPKLEVPSNWPDESQINDLLDAIHERVQRNWGQKAVNARAWFAGQRWCMENPVAPSPTDAVAEGRKLVEELHDKYNASRRKDDEAAERHYERGDNTSGKKYADRADAFEDKQDAIAAFLAHNAAQSRQLAEVREAIEKMPVIQGLEPHSRGMNPVFALNRAAVLALFPRSPETNDAG